MFDLVAGGHHGAGWMTTGFAVFLWSALPFVAAIFIYRFVRDARALRRTTGPARTDLSDRLLGWGTALFIIVGALFLATHRLWTAWASKG